MSVCASGHRPTDLAVGCRTCGAREPARTPLMVMLPVVAVVVVTVVVGTDTDPEIPCKGGDLEKVNLH